MSNKIILSVTAIQSALAAEGLLHGRSEPFSGQWDSVTANGYAQYVRTVGGLPGQEQQPRNLESIPGPLRDAVEDAVLSEMSAANPQALSRKQQFEAEQAEKAQKQQAERQAKADKDAEDQRVAAAGQAEADRVAAESVAAAQAVQAKADAEAAEVAAKADKKTEAPAPAAADVAKNPQPNGGQQNGQRQGNNSK